MIHDILDEFIKFDFIDGVNVLLVCYDCRKTTLFESTNWDLSSYEDRIQHMIYIENNFLKRLNLLYVYDKLSLSEYPRWFIVKSINVQLVSECNTVTDVGFILGMHCYDHTNYGNFYVDRYVGSILINNKSIFTEVANPSNKNFDISAFENSVLTKTIEWNYVLAMFDLYCYYTIKYDIGLITLKQNIDDIAFVSKHIDEYNSYLVSNIDEFANFDTLSIDQIRDAFSKIVL